MFRKIVNILGMLCLVLVLGAGGTAGYLAAKGTLSSRSLKTAMAAITVKASESAGTQPAAGSEAKAATSQPRSPAAEHRAAGENDLEDLQADNEAASGGRLEMMRRQLANEQALQEAVRVKLQRDQEQFEQERKLWAATRQKEMASNQQGGVQKELDYLSSIKPAQALALLRTKSDDQASRILMAMETRKGKKIIELCKTADDKDWVKRILELIRQQSNIQAQALTGG
jgi:hypothetical protein